MNALLDAFERMDETERGLVNNLYGLISLSAELGDDAQAQQGADEATAQAAGLVFSNPTRRDDEVMVLYPPFCGSGNSYRIRDALMSLCAEAQEAIVDGDMGAMIGRAVIGTESLAAVDEACERVARLFEAAINE